MVEFKEKRKDLRHKHKSPVMIHNPESGTSYRGRMLNFSNHGLFLETSVELKAGKVKTDQEMRKHPRRPYHKPVYFTSQNQYYKGTIKNLSRSGAFIETIGNFAARQLIRLVIPGTKIDKGTLISP